MKNGDFIVRYVSLNTIGIATLKLFFLKRSVFRIYATVSEELHLQHIVLFQYCKIFIVNINTRTGKFFKTAYIMPKLSSALCGTINMPSRNTRVPRKPGLRAHV